MLLEICALSKMYRCISKNLNIVKKLFFYNISKSEIFIYSRLITRKVKHLQVFFYDYSLQLMKVKNPVSQTIRMFPKINQKKDLQNRTVQVL